MFKVQFSPTGHC